MENKRVPRTDDSQYWHDPDYHEGLEEVGLEITYPSAASPPRTKVDAAASPSRESVAEKIIFAPFTLIKYAFLLATWIAGGLGTWAGISPLIWLVDIVTGARIPGIELPIIFIIQLLYKSSHHHAGW